MSPLWSRTTLRPLDRSGSPLLHRFSSLFPGLPPRPCRNSRSFPSEPPRSTSTLHGSSQRLSTSSILRCTCRRQPPPSQGEHGFRRRSVRFQEQDWQIVSPPLNSNSLELLRSCDELEVRILLPVTRFRPRSSISTSFLDFDSSQDLSSLHVQYIRVGGNVE